MALFANPPCYYKVTMQNRTEFHESLVELTRRCRVFAYIADNSNQPKFWAESNAPQFVLANALEPHEVKALIAQPPMDIEIQ